jgi:hypothetical protein
MDEPVPATPAVKPSKLLLFISIAVWLLVASAAAYSIWRPTGVSDYDKAEDLFKIETAINKYYEAGHNVNGESALPSSLRQIQGSNLKGTQNDYQYTPKSLTSNGGPTVYYTLCTSFLSATVKFPLKYGSFPGPTEGSDNIYTVHRKGKQCFENSYYKSSSHVYAVFDKPGEVSPKPPLHIDTKSADFTKLYSDAQKYASSHTRVLGISYSEQDLVKVCRQNDEVSDAPSKKTFYCWVEFQKKAPVTFDINEGKRRMSQFFALTRSQGSNSDDTFGWLREGDESSPYASFETNIENCHLEAEINTYPSEIEHGLSYKIACCSSATGELPHGFKLADKDYQGVNF